ncbi:MAG: hypothetical protein PHR28_01875 [candidate division Zixibacteria bacterium]|nr:hypothetical protein [candidate division Zixibacteria bacterium]
MYISRCSVVATACIVFIAGLLAIGCGDDDTSSNPVTSNSLPGAWAPVGTGIGVGDLGQATALSVIGDTLVLGGDFDFVDSITSHSIAVWNGSSWGPLGSGVTGGPVRAFTEYGEYLIAGGEFDHVGAITGNHVALWDGSSLAPLSTGRATDVFALASYQTTVITGGVSGTNGGFGAFNGLNWTTLASNITVRALTVYNDTLIVGGTFSDLGNASGDNIFAFTGFNSLSLGSGINGSVYALTVYDGTLIAGGSFTVAGGDTVSNIAAWDGSAWTALGSGINGAVFGLTVWDNRLIACGQFSTAGGKGAACIAAWDGSSWKSLGSGANATVWAVTAYGVKLIACGNFTNAGGVAARGIAAWTPQ